MSAVWRGFLTLPAPKVRSEHTKDQSGSASHSVCVTEANMIWIRHNSFILYQFIPGVRSERHGNQYHLYEKQVCGLVTGLIKRRICFKGKHLDLSQENQLDNLFN